MIPCNGSGERANDRPDHGKSQNRQSHRFHDRSKRHRSAALQEDVHVVGLSILSGAHNAIVPRVMDLLKQNKMDDVLVVVGGIIPDQDIAALKKAGVGAIFQPGTSMDEIVSYIRDNVKRHDVPASS